LIDAGKYVIPRDFYSDPLGAWGALLQKGYAAVLNFLESNDYYVLQIVVQGASEGMIWGIRHKQEKEWFWSSVVGSLKDDDNPVLVEVMLK